MLEKIKAVLSDELAQSDSPVIALFYATYCPLCLGFASIFEKYSVNQPYIFAKADIPDNSHPYWDKYKINYVPTVIAFKSGQIWLEEPRRLVRVLVKRIYLKKSPPNSLLLMNLPKPLEPSTTPSSITTTPLTTVYVALPLTDQPSNSTHALAFV